MKANASQHKAMSYGRMEQREKELEAEIHHLLRTAEATDAEEDQRYGQGRRGNELPEELAFREKRLQKIKEAKAALQARVQQKKGKETPGPKDQIHFTDPESRIMKDPTTKGFLQGYNAQCAVDAPSQVIVAADVTIQTNDKQQMEPMIHRIEENLGSSPQKLSADAGYFSEDNIRLLQDRGVRPSSLPIGCAIRPNLLLPHGEGSRRASPFRTA